MYLAVMVGLMTLATACSDDDPEPENGAAPDVQLTEIGNLGNVLVDGEGMTLYFFTKDVAGMSACLDGCLDVWPIFYKADLTVSTELNSGDFGVITRDDGAKQTTYKGWPLYYFGDDVAANDVNGEGVGEVWFVAKPDYSIMLADQELDGTATNYFVDDEGRTLYYFANDEENISNCSDGCLSAWPVFGHADEIIVPSTLNATDFGQIDGNDGSKQMTYQGRPLYYFAQDQQRGETKGRSVVNWSLSNF